MMTQLELIKEICLKSKSTNPIEIARTMMHDPSIHIHGPEHHILDGAAFLCAMYNAGVDFDLNQALDEIIKRGLKMPGAICGQWGICGSCASVGAALAIIHQTGPLSDNEFYKDNLRLTSQALNQIGEIGGPRCCKRNAFLSLKSAIVFVKEHYDIELEDETVICEFSSQNMQCIKERCPFHERKK